MTADEGAPIDTAASREADAEAQAELRAIFDAAVAAADARIVLAGHLPPPPARGRVVVVGAGKAAAAMAQAVEAAWGDALGARLSGRVVTCEGYGLATGRIEVVEAAHPAPDARGAAAARQILDLAGDLGAGDTALALISGGGSALLTAPAGEVTLADKQALTRELLACGAAIGEINCVRKHLSAIKGGRLAQAIHPARLLTLAVSDVPGDDPSVIASGPTVPDPTMLVEARAVLYRYRVRIPERIAAHLRDRTSETPKPGDPVFARMQFRLIARPADALAAAAEAAARLGYQPIALGDAVEGEAREVACEHVRLARGLAERGARAALISGGELTVTIKGRGSGGPNREYALALARELGGLEGVYALAADTDGMDGAPDGAGAFVAPSTLIRAACAGLDAGAMLRANDSGAFFRALNDDFVPGPTRTNVNDLRIILVGRGRPSLACDIS